jgi:hypothetical protein
MDISSAIDEYREEAIALGEELGRTYGVPWETWDSDQTYVLEIYRQGDLQVEKWAAAVYPFGHYWFKNYEKLGWRLGLAGFFAPMIVGSILWQIPELLNAATLIAPFLLALVIPCLIFKNSINPPNNKFKRLRDKLMDFVFDGAYEEVQRMRYGSESENPSDWAASVGNRWTPQGPKPVAVPGEITPNQAENYVVAWLKYLGVPDIEPTRYSQDGGIDAESQGYVVQVKHYSSPVSVQPIRELYGVAMSLGKESCFFAQSGYTKDAVKFGEDTGMALFTYSVETGDLYAITRSAHKALSQGL